MAKNRNKKNKKDGVASMDTSSDAPNDAPQGLPFRTLPNSTPISFLLAIVVAELWIHPFPFFLMDCCSNGHIWRETLECICWWCQQVSTLLNL